MKLTTKIEDIFNSQSVVAVRIDDEMVGKDLCKQRCVVKWDCAYVILL